MVIFSLELRLYLGLESCLNVSIVSMVKEIIRNIFQPEIAPVIFLVKTHKCGSRFCHLTIFLVCFFQNQSDQYVNDYGNNQRYSPAIYTHCYDTSGTKLVDPNKLDFKEIICLTSDAMKFEPYFKVTILGPFLVIFSQTACIYFTKIRFRWSFEGV